MGTKIGDGRGNIILGAEYYDRRAAYQKNRDFYTEGWSDPGIGGQYLYLFGTNGINTVSTPPSKASLNALFPTRGTATTPYVLPYPGSGILAGLRFNADGTIWDPAGPIGSSNYEGPTTGQGYGLVNVYDTTHANNVASPPTVVQTLKWNNPNETVSEPQTRYSFYGQRHVRPHRQGAVLLQRALCAESDLDVLLPDFCELRARGDGPVQRHDRQSGQSGTADRNQCAADCRCVRCEPH